MGYIKNLKWTVADLLLSRQTNPKRDCSCAYSRCSHYLGDIPKAPSFVILDSVLDRHLSIGITGRDVGLFVRKAGQYGLIFEQGLRIPVGSMSDSKYSREGKIFQVHIVEEEDCITTQHMLTTPFETNIPSTKPEFETI